MRGVLKGRVDLSNSIGNDRVHQYFEVIAFIALDSSEHVVGAAVEVTLEVVTRVCQVVSKCTLLDKIVFLVDTDVLHLLFGRDEMLPVFLLNNICPLAGQLSVLVLDVGVIENCEFRAWGPCEVSGLSCAAE